MYDLVECTKPTLPTKEPTDPNYIRDGTTSDYDAWKDSWTCWAFKDDYEYCNSPENRHHIDEDLARLNQACQEDPTCDIDNVEQETFDIDGFM